VERPGAARAGPPALRHPALALALAAALSAGCRRAPAPAPAPAAADSARAAADTGRQNGRSLVDPSSAVRFEIVAVGDTTFAFLAPRADWLRPQMRGIVVDPRRRDVLIARFVVLDARGDSATALVTGQTTRVVADHVALLSKPPLPPRVISRVERRRFWSGAAIGGLFGLIAGLLVRL